ncbi:MAG: aminotransferase class V-fold PLP-dependent enzyme [Myxococcales bacterium]|nr:aminotransferase class V-fold PLP-dependent enzyme [Myxococcales bacterium]
MSWHEAFRAEMPALARLAYLNSGTAGPTPRPVAEAMIAEQRYELEHSRGNFADFGRLFDQRDGARSLAARVLGADPEEVALVHSSSEAINIVLGSYDFGPHDVLLTTSLEHDAAMVPLGLLCARHGPRLEVIDVGLGAGDDALAPITRALREHAEHARMLVLSHVSYSSGTLLPLEPIAAACREAGVQLLVDGAQTCGVLPVDVKALGCDYYTLSGQKWLLGPEGSGALYVRRELIGAMRPPATSYFSAAHHDFAGHVELHESAARFETSMINRPVLAGFVAAMRLMLDEVGIERAYERSLSLAARCAERVARIEGVELVTPQPQQTSLVTFDLPGFSPRALSGAATVLADEHDVICRCVHHEPYGLRAALGFFNDERDIERLAVGVAAVLSRGPEAMPVDAWAELMPEAR